jgi:hypothetical protein
MALVIEINGKIVPELRIIVKLEIQDLPVGIRTLLGRGYRVPRCGLRKYLECGKRTK